MRTKAVIGDGHAEGRAWSEIDFGAKVWTVPEHRIKAKKGHEFEFRVPLSDAMIAFCEKATA